MDNTNPLLPVTTCTATCPDETFANDNNICTDCTADCKTCSDEHVCEDCMPGFYLLEGSEQCVATCGPGYYSSGGECNYCDTRCATCTSLSVCTSCLPGFYIAGTVCKKECGNGDREGDEVCDDDNNINGDGCDS